MKKKKLLLVTAIPPFPQDSGGATRIKNTIKELSKSFSLYLISFKNENYELSPEEKSDLNNWCKQIIYVPIGNHKIFGSYLDLGQPYWFSEWYSPELITIIKSVLNNQYFDLIQIETSQLLYLIDYLDKIDQKKCIFTAYDISTISFYRRLTEIKNIKQKIIHFFRFIEIFLYEKKYIQKYRIINAVSQNDSILLKKYFHPNRVFTLVNGIEKVEFLKTKEKRNDTTVLGYIGSFSHPPNRTAFLYFINEIATKLEENNINYKYLLAGNNDNREINCFLSKVPSTIRNKIINLGFVDSPKYFFQKIDILITPIFAGSGSRIKILEALSFGKKVISSKVGVEGINLNTNLISICNTSQDYINEIKIFQAKKNNLDYNQEKEKINQLTWEHIFKNYLASILLIIIPNSRKSLPKSNSAGI
ncbi:MAG: glycosyltransferase [Candidatus Shapirobacteria bacterium]|nr:glycosyltransferase [Candidatus Shapirobacteria bacterium]